MKKTVSVFLRSTALSDNENIQICFSGLIFYPESHFSGLTFYPVMLFMGIFAENFRTGMYIKRQIDKYLQEWKDSVSFKPLLLRGARQVGKSSSVKEFGKQFEYYLEINFEKKEHHNVKKIFERSSSPRRIVDELYAVFGVPVVPGKTLLFIDEIQNCIPAISSLRFFYEEMPELHAVCRKWWQPTQKAVLYRNVNRFWTI